MRRVAVRPWVRRVRLVVYLDWVRVFRFRLLCMRLLTVLDGWRGILLVRSWLTRLVLVANGLV